jgi:ribosomal protein L11 methyltransferase
LSHRSPLRLETIAIDVPEAAVEHYESALRSVCSTIGFFMIDEEKEIWRIEGIKAIGENEPGLVAALSLAELMTGVPPAITRTETEAEGWLARTYSSFPEQLVGQRFAVRGTHLTGPTTPGRLTITLDAGVAFGSGEHESTRGCLLALERLARTWSAHRGPTRILDLGSGSGILAMAASRLPGPSRRKILATDIEPWSVRVAASNAALNRLTPKIQFILANGWRNPTVQAGAPYDLVFANILARPLCQMAGDLAANLAPGGRVILAGLLASQARMVIAAHRRHGLILDHKWRDGNWMCLTLRKGTVRK